jgi:hypothetical protein
LEDSDSSVIRVEEFPGSILNSSDFYNGTVKFVTECEIAVKLDRKIFSRNGCLFFYVCHAFNSRMNILNLCRRSSNHSTSCLKMTFMGNDNHILC